MNANAKVAFIFDIFNSSVVPLCCRLSRQPCLRLRIQRRCLSQSRPSWLQTSPMSSSNFWRKLSWITLSLANTGDRGLMLPVYIRCFRLWFPNKTLTEIIFLLVFCFSETSRICSSWQPLKLIGHVLWSTSTVWTTTMPQTLPTSLSAMSCLRKPLLFLENLMSTPLLCRSVDDCSTLKKKKLNIMATRMNERDVTWCECCSFCPGADWAHW